MKILNLYNIIHKLCFTLSIYKYYRLNFVEIREINKDFGRNEQDYYIKLHMWDLIIVVLDKFVEIYWKKFEKYDQIYVCMEC
jgi:hypothetical protein